MNETCVRTLATSKNYNMKEKKLTPEQRKAISNYERTFEKTFLKKLTELSNTKKKK